MATTPNETVITERPEGEKQREYPFGRVRDRKSPIFKFVVIGGIALVIVGVVAWWIYASRWESTDDAQVDAHIYAISARVSGQVVKVNVDDNQQVKAGTVLVEIDPADYQVTLQRLEAELADAKANADAARVGLPITTTTTSSSVESAKADVENNLAGLQSAQQQYEAAMARLREAEANNERAQADVARYKQLVEKDEVSKQQYDQAFAAAKAAAATVDATRAAVSSAQQQIAQARSKITQAQSNLRSANTAPQQVRNSQARLASAEAQVQKAQANLNQAKLNLQYTKITAPVDGLVGRRSVEAGQNVQTGKELICADGGSYG